MTSIQIKKRLKSKIDKVIDNGKLLSINEAVDNILESEPLKWDSLCEAEKNSILEGLEQLEKGESIDFEDLKREINEWLKK
ncbi:MAG: hypothetical protein ABI840_07140 [bacterium]